MIKGFNVRNEREAGPVREDPTQSLSLARRLVILESWLKFLHISGTPGNLLLMFSICSGQVDTASNNRTTQALPCFSFSLDFQVVLQSVSLWLILT